MLIPDGIRTRNLEIRSLTPCPLGHGDHKHIAATRDRTGDLQIFSLTLSQLSYSGADQLKIKEWRIRVSISVPVRC